MSGLDALKQFISTVKVINVSLPVFHFSDCVASVVPFLSLFLCLTKVIKVY